MKKFKKIIAMGCAAVMAMSVMSISAFAADNLKVKSIITPNSSVESITNKPGCFLLEGEIGTKYESDGIVYEIVGTPDSNTAIANDGIGYDVYETKINVGNEVAPYASKKAFTIALTGTTKRASFTLSGNYTYWKVWAQSTQTSGQTIISVEGPNGNTIGDVVTMPAGYTAQVYSDQDSEFPTGTYKVYFTSGDGLSGTASCRLATTWDELDVTE